MSNKLAVQRLLREYQKMSAHPNAQFVAVPNPENLFEWHFVIHSLKQSAFEGGVYHGKLVIPVEYPMKPPTLYFVTPQGRFKVGEKICLSFTSFHPESWSTSWTIDSMLVALISFMHTEELTTGGLKTSPAEKARLARESLAFNARNPDFLRIFKSHLPQLGVTSEQEALRCSKHTFVAPAPDEDENQL